MVDWNRLREIILGRKWSSMGISLAGFSLGAYVGGEKSIPGGVGITLLFRGLAAANDDWER